MGKVGMFGHSRGTLTGMAEAGGSSAWGVTKDARVQAVMGMASGARRRSLQPNLSDIDVPTLVVAGGLDQKSPQQFNEDLFKQFGCPVVTQPPATPPGCEPEGRQAGADAHPAL